MITCDIPGRLYRSPRPGRFDPGIDHRNVPSTTVDRWIQTVHRHGIKRVLCLLDDVQLGYYRQLSGGLLANYGVHGLDVTHLPTIDHEPVPQHILDLAAAWFAKDTRPALVHCSAGIERTGAVVSHLIALNTGLCSTRSGRGKNRI